MQKQINLSEPLNPSPEREVQHGFESGKRSPRLSQRVKSSFFIAAFLTKVVLFVSQAPVLEQVSNRYVNYITPMAWVSAVPWGLSHLLMTGFLGWHTRFEGPYVSYVRSSFHKMVWLDIAWTLFARFELLCAASVVGMYTCYLLLKMVTKRPSRNILEQSLVAVPNTGPFATVQFEEKRQNAVKRQKAAVWREYLNIHLPVSIHAAWTAVTALDTANSWLVGYGATRETRYWSALLSLLALGLHSNFRLLRHRDHPYALSCAALAASICFKDQLRIAELDVQRSLVLTGLAGYIGFELTSMMVLQKLKLLQ
ncbi:unnamed protein product [Chrysoparadoxa australica]